MVPTERHHRWWSPVVRHRSKDICGPVVAFAYTWPASTSRHWAVVVVFLFRSGYLCSDALLSFCLTPFT